MKLQITHQTNYFYNELARHSVQYIRMTPISSLAHQTIHQWQVRLPKMAKEQQDGFKNQLLTLSRNEPHDNLQIQALGVVEINENTANIVDDTTIPYQIFCVVTPLTKCSQEMRDFYQSILAEYKQDLSVDVKLDLLKKFAEQLLQKMPYQRNVTHAGTLASEAFAIGGGVCQDHSHVFIACLRDLGIPTRYVSGYIYDEAGDHMASHAWAEAYIDGYWYTFDISNLHFTPNAHVYVSIGRDYADTAPVRGVRTGGGYESLYSQVKVERLP